MNSTSDESLNTVTSELIRLCDTVIADKKKIASSMFMSSAEAGRLKVTCQRMNIGEILAQLHGYQGEPNPREYISRLNAVRRAVNIAPTPVVPETVELEFQLPSLGF